MSLAAPPLPDVAPFPLPVGLAPSPVMGPCPGALPCDHLLKPPCHWATFSSPVLSLIPVLEPCFGTQSISGTLTHTPHTPSTRDGARGYRASGRTYRWPQYHALAGLNEWTSRAGYERVTRRDAKLERSIRFHNERKQDL